MSLPLPVLEEVDTAPETIIRLQQQIRDLAAQRHAVILAHNYQRSEVQDVADFVGDSLGLSRQATSTESEIIVFCGVHFMAETAAILSPEKRVLLPDLRAGCSLAASITAQDVRDWRAEFPDYVAVGYVNTTAVCIHRRTVYNVGNGYAMKLQPVTLRPRDGLITFLQCRSERRFTYLP